MAAAELPECVTRLLWDVDPRGVTLDLRRDFLIGRVLAQGEWDAIRWLRQAVDDDVLRGWIVATRGRSLSRRQIRFWQLLLELPEGTVEPWLRAPERAVWDQRTA